MDALCTTFLERLRAGSADREILARAGEPDPARAAGAFERACSEPDLADACERWAPECLLGARPGFAAESLFELARAHRERRGGPLRPERLGAAARVLAGSNFLARLLVRDPEYADALDAAGPLPRPATEWSALRRFKYGGLLRVAARELGGDCLEESLRILSDLADACLEAALRRAAEETGVAAPALFGLGKLGGRELNFSSDVDLLFVYESGAGLERNHEVARLVRCFKSGLETPGPEGFAYRVDLDLRPEGPTGVLANSVGAALDYYESFGAEWERQMLIRLRPLAGPRPLLDEFARGILPFVYRRSVDSDALRRVQAMKLRIEEERRAQRRDLEADLKEGPGGIRDVEFLVQALQLFYGGRHPELRTGNVLEALAVLERIGVLPAPIARSLADAYRWLRRAEHAVQMAEERQTHLFPRHSLEQGRLARRMGYRDPEIAVARARLLEDWTGVRTEVRGQFEALVLGDA